MSTSPGTGADPVQLLVMCTANQCRSPMAAAMAADLLARRGAPAAVASCGVMEGGRPASRGAVRTMARRGHDLSDHRSRRLDPGLLAWATLVITMERRHLVEVAELDPGALGRAFTLPELADVARLVGPRLPGQSPAEWVARCAAAREPSSVLGYGTADDVEDPMGGPARAYRRAATEIEELLEVVIGMLYPS